jgi:hypothetical protein
VLAAEPGSGLVVDLFVPKIKLCERECVCGWQNKLE